MPTKRILFTRIALLAVLLLTAVAPIYAAKESSYMTGFTRWRSADGDFAGWEYTGVLIDANGALVLDPAAVMEEADPYAPGAYNGGNFYTGGSYDVGEAVSPVVTADFAFAEAIASWNADTPDGTWVETLIQARIDGRWTKWYNLGVWASETDTVQRHSVRAQGDSDGYVATDTLVVTAKKAAPDAFKIKVRLFSLDRTAVTPVMRNLSVAYSTTAAKKATLQPGDPANWGTLLDVPECSQMVYPDGGEVWCSPTSTSMVLGYWGEMPGPCEPRVKAAVSGTLDWIYNGYGNWPFNTAYAASLGYEGYVARFTSLAQAEPWVAAGVPVIVSFAWGKGDLAGAPIPSSNGHLAVLVGFDATGNPIINDPAASSDEAVQRTYDRAEFETMWLVHSGGTVYLIYPAGHPTPAM